MCPGSGGKAGVESNYSSHWMPLGVWVWAEHRQGRTRARAHSWRVDDFPALSPWGERHLVLSLCYSVVNLSLKTSVAPFTPFVFWLPVGIAVTWKTFDVNSVFYHRFLGFRAAIAAFCSHTALGYISLIIEQTLKRNNTCNQAFPRVPALVLIDAPQAHVMSWAGCHGRRLWVL